MDINLILKKIAVDSPNWIPEFIQDYLKKIDKIEKNPKLRSFRTPLDIKDVLTINKAIVDNFVEELMSEIGLVEDHLSSLKMTIKEFESPEGKYSDICGKIDGLINKINDLYSNTTYQTLQDNKILVKKNMFKFSKYYEFVMQAVKTFIIEIIPIILADNNLAIKDRIKRALSSLQSPTPFDKVKGKPDWDNRNLIQELEIVFTTNYNDILGMSSRSTWTSCQDLRPTKQKQFAAFISQIIGSAIEKDVGVIYITNKGQYKEYGEQILYRSVVWMIYNKTSDSEALFLPIIYPFDSNPIRILFSNALEDNLEIPVIEDKDIAETDYFTKFTMLHPGPYKDLKLENAPEAQAESQRLLAERLINGIKNPNIKNQILEGSYFEAALRIVRQIATKDTPLNIYHTETYDDMEVYDENKVKNLSPILFYEYEIKPISIKIINSLYDSYTNVFEKYKINPAEDNIFNKTITAHLLETYHQRNEDYSLIKSAINMFAYNNPVQLAFGRNLEKFKPPDIPLPVFVDIVTLSFGGFYKHMDK